jgi:hypothetical protein
MTIIITDKLVNDTFDEINRLLFFSQLEKPKFEIENLDTEFSYCFKEEGDAEYTLGISNDFDKIEHFRYIMMIEMIRLYQMRDLEEEPSFNSMYSILEYNGFKKIKNIEDPHSDIDMTNY